MPEPGRGNSISEASGAACFETLGANAGRCQEVREYRKRLGGRGLRRSERGTVLLRRCLPGNLEEVGGSLHEHQRHRCRECLSTKGAKVLRHRGSVAPGAPSIKHRRCRSTEAPGHQRYKGH
ncbi:UNVERIFIED_CONTAM: hypothetical protein FKN15_062770 [Acipenser sinensis]